MIAEEGPWGPSAGDQLNSHPHLHALVTRGGCTASGEWIGVPYVDRGAAELLFRHEVIRLLVGAGLLDEDRVRVLPSWRHTGFSVHSQVTLRPPTAAPWRLWPARRPP